MIGGSGKWILALVASVALHVSAAAWFYNSSDEEQVEGGALTQISVLGDAFQEEIAAGNPAEAVEPTPAETVETSEVEVTDAAEEVIEEAVSKPVETIEPALSQITEIELVKDLTPEKQITEAKPETVPVTKAVQPPLEIVDVSESQTALMQVPEIQLAEITIASLQPQQPILAVTTQQLEQVTKPQEPEEVTEPQEPEQVTKPQETQKTIKPEPEVVKKKPAARLAKKPATRAKKKPVKKKKRAEKKNEKKKQRKKKTATNSGSGGRAKKNARAGTANGARKAAKKAGKSNGKKSRKAGNASVSNYKGKVRRKVRRKFRRPRKGKRLRADAVVRFVLSKSGSVRSVRLVRSSGSSKLDKAALSAVRRASPFPKPPGNFGGSSLDFTIPFGA